MMPDRSRRSRWYWTTETLVILQLFAISLTVGAKPLSCLNAEMKFKMFSRVRLFAMALNSY